MSKHVVARATDIPPGARKLVTVRGRPIAVFNLGGTFYGLLNRCPHQGGPMCEGVVTGLIESDTPGEYRFSRAGEWQGVVVYDDYAHHPVEIAAVLRGARMAGNGRIIAVMQPHRYTRLQALFNEFSACLDDADIVVVTPVYSAGEPPIPGIDRDELASGLRRHGHPHVLTVDDEESLTETIATIAKEGDLVVGLGAGTITDWINALPSRLEQRGGSA